MAALGVAAEAAGSALMMPAFGSDGQPGAVAAAADPALVLVVATAGIPSSGNFGTLSHPGVSVEPGSPAVDPGGGTGDNAASPGSDGHCGGAGADGCELSGRLVKRSSSRPDSSPESSKSFAGSPGGN